MLYPTEKKIETLAYIFAGLNQSRAEREAGVLRGNSWHWLKDESLREQAHNLYKRAVEEARNSKPSPVKAERWISPEGRRAISEAAKRRWENYRREKETHEGKEWVKPCIRNGKKISGYWRKKLDHAEHFSGWWQSMTPEQRSEHARQAVAQRRDRRSA